MRKHPTTTPSGNLFLRRNYNEITNYFRHLALSYSTFHEDMADPNRKGCGDAESDKFGKEGGITNGAKWYSLEGGNCAIERKNHRDKTLILPRNARLQLPVE